MNTELTKSIEIATADAYSKIAEARRIPLDEVHRHYICRGVSALILGHELFGREVAIHFEGRLIPLFGDQTGIYAEHHYLVYGDGAGGEEIIDASWQQFLPKDIVSSQLPKVLVGRRADFVGQAFAAGIPVEALDFWKPLGEADSVAKVML